jgi:hypothetical protein
VSAGCVALPVEVFVQLVLGAGAAGALLAVMLVGLGHWFLGRLDRWTESTGWWQRVEQRALAIRAARESSESSS